MDGRGSCFVCARVSIHTATRKRTVFRDLLLLSREGVPTVTGFMSDQKPSKGDNTHVLTFLNHPTAVITGTEALGRKLKMAAVYGILRRPAKPIKFTV